MTILKIFLLFVILFISSCSEKIQTNGISSKSIEQMEFKVGITTKNELIQKYGPPAFESVFNNNVIYYISHESSYKNFKARKTKKLKVLEITLDKQNRVKSIENFTEKNAQNITVSKEITKKTENSGLFLKQILDSLRKP